MLQEVADGVFVWQSELLHNNAVAVSGTSGALLADPGQTADELIVIAHDLRDAGLAVSAGFATHPDWDHVLWHAELGSAPRYGTARCAADMRDLLSTANWKERIREGLPPEIADEVPLDLFGLITALPANAERLPWDGSAVRVIEHRAHAAGHAALLIADRRVLIAGDMLSDILVPMLDLDAAAPIEDYLAALDLLERVADEVDVVVPGHGSAGGAAELRARIDQDRAYVIALRDGTRPADPRLDSPEPGWEWVGDIDAWQRERLGRETQGSSSA